LGIPTGSFKTGKVGTQTVTGTVAIVFPDCRYLGFTNLYLFVMNLCGIAQVSMTGTYSNGEQDYGGLGLYTQYGIYGQYSIVAGPDASYNSDYESTSYPLPFDGPYSRSGTYTLAIDYEEWVTFSDTTTPYLDPNYGIVSPSPSVSAVYYLATKIGGNQSATITFEGQTVSWSETSTSSVEMDLSLSLIANIGPSSQYCAGDASLTGTFSSSLPINIATASAYQSQYSSEDNITLIESAEITSSTFTSTIATSSLTQSGYPGLDLVSPQYVCLEVTIYPSRNYIATGIIYALDQEFTGSVPINFSKYYGDPSPTTSGPSFGGSAQQQKYSYNLIAAYYAGYAGAGESYIASVDQTQPVTATTTNAWCVSNNEVYYFYTEVDDGGDEPVIVAEMGYNNQFRIHGYIAEAMTLALPSSFSVDASSSLAKWTGGFLTGEGIGCGECTTDAIAWSSTDATLLDGIQSALQSIPAIGSGNCSAAAGTLASGNGTITVTFGGYYALGPFPGLSVNGSGLSGGTVTAAKTTAGKSPVGGIAGATEVWTLTFTGVTGGSFTITAGATALTWNAIESAATATTGGIAFSGTASTLQTNVQSALDACPLVGSGNSVVSVSSASPDTGGGTGTALFTIAFEGSLAGQTISQCGINYSGTGTCNPGGQPTGSLITVSLTAMSSGDTFSFTIRIGDPYFNASGYRYLKFTNCLTDSETPQTRTLTIAGKTWTVVFPSTTAADVIIDLCNPTTGGAIFDITDSILAPGDCNPTLNPTGAATDGPLWGITYLTSFALTGFEAGSIESFGRVALVVGNSESPDLLSVWSTLWEPRFSSMTQYGPQWTNGGDAGTTFNVAENRACILITDGRQSWEHEAQGMIYIQPDSGVDTFEIYERTISDIVDIVNGGYALNGGPVGESANGGDNPYFGYYSQVPNGWTASKVIVASDDSDMLSNGYINDQLPSGWLNGDGCTAVPNAGGFSFQTSIGISPRTVQAQVLLSSISFYGGCGDVLGMGGSSPTPNTVYIPMSKVYRSQAWGLLLENPANGNAPPGTVATLYPAKGETQPSGTSVGVGSSGSPWGSSPTGQGDYATTGIALDGIVTVGPVLIYGTETYTTTGSRGVVFSQIAGAAMQSVTQNFNEAKVSRVAIRLPTASSPTAVAGILDIVEGINNVSAIVVFTPMEMPLVYPSTNDFQTIGSTYAIGAATDSVYGCAKLDKSDQLLVGTGRSQYLLAQAAAQSASPAGTLLRTTDGILYAILSESDATTAGVPQAAQITSVGGTPNQLVASSWLNNLSNYAPFTYCWIGGRLIFATETNLYSSTNDGATATDITPTAMGTPGASSSGHNMRPVFESVSSTVFLLYTQQPTTPDEGLLLLKCLISRDLGTTWTATDLDGDAGGTVDGNSVPGSTQPSVDGGPGWSSPDDVGPSIASIPDQIVGAVANGQRIIISYVDSNGNLQILRRTITNSSDHIVDGGTFS
jgi:hypothetical protein